MAETQIVETWILLLENESYRTFLQKYVEVTKQKRSFGYASLARQAGFASRSFPRDLVTGHRDMTAATLPRFVRALGLTGEAARTFSFLVYKEHPNLYDGKKKEELPRLLELSKSKLRKQIENRGSEQVSVFLNPHWPIVYASVGSEDRGASLQDVSDRSKLPREKCETLLTQMIRENLVSKNEITNQYFSKNSHVLFENLGANDGFKKFFCSSLRRAETDAKKAFDKKDRLFFSSAISVKRSDLHEYRSKLRELLNSFAESAEEPNGDDVVTLVCGLFPQH